MYGKRRVPLAWGAFRVAGAGIMRDGLPTDRLATSTAVMYGSFGVGGSLCLPIAALVAENHDWHVPGRHPSAPSWPSSLCCPCPSRRYGWADAPNSPVPPVRQPDWCACCSGVQDRGLGAQLTSLSKSPGGNT